MEYKYFSMQELRNPPLDLAIDILQHGKLHDVRWILLQKCEKVLDQLCQDFGVGQVPSVQVAVIAGKKQQLATTIRTFFSSKPDIMWHSIEFSLDACRTVPEYIFTKTLPHEVAHVFHFEFFPETRVNGYHGQIWISLMEHLQLKPDVVAGISSAQVARIYEYEEIVE